jgi:hypothetical protein
VEGAPPSQRVTPPRTSQEEAAPTVPGTSTGQDEYTTAPHTLGDALTVFYDTHPSSETDSSGRLEETFTDDILAPVDDEARRTGVDQAIHVLTGRAATMSHDGRENGSNHGDAAEANVHVALRKLAAQEAKIDTWKDQLITRELRAVKDEIMRVQLRPEDSSLRERLKEVYERAKARREAILAERYRWESLIFEAECSADDSNAKLAEVDKCYTDIDHACRGELFETAKKLMRNPNDGLAGADSKLFKLPAVEVPSFKGNLAEFPSFERAFQAVIGTSKLPDQYKLVHLKNALKGETTGLSTIVGTAAADYQRLWDLLHARYGNEASLRAQVMADFMALKGKTSEGPLGLRRLHDGVVTKFNRLKEVDPAAATRKEWVMLVIQPLYPREIRRRICERLGQEEPDIDDFLATAEQLISREMRMEHADQVNPLNGKTPKKNTTGHNNGKLQNNNKSGGFRFHGTTAGLAAGEATSKACQGGAHNCCKQAACAATTSSRKRQQTGRKAGQPSKQADGQARRGAGQPQRKQANPCHCCGADCGTLRCAKFMALSKEKKKEVLRKAKRCFKCLRSMDGHKATCNTFAICKKCSGKHWTQLHELHSK